VGGLRSAEERVREVREVGHVRNDLIARRAIRERVQRCRRVRPDHLGENVERRGVVADERNDVP